MTRPIGVLRRTIVLSLALAGLAVSAEAATYPTGFGHAVVAGGLDTPTGFAFFPDGRIAIAEKSGVVRLVKNGQLLPTPLIDVSDRVNDYWDRGLLGIALDSDFGTNPNLYLLYVYENGLTPYTGTKTSRLARYTVSGDTADPGTEVVILGNVEATSCNHLPAGSGCIPADAPYHSVGSVKSAGGTIFLSVGDAAEFYTVDALRSQNLGSLAGKLLRVDRNGRGVPSNPFWNGNADALRSKVWAYGFRNPFRFGFRPGSGTSVVYVGDVGANHRDEINVVTAGGNFGWPCYEGAGQHDAYAGFATCQALYAQGGAAAARRPIHEYGPGQNGFAVIGGAFVTGAAYPATYQEAYFFADYAQGWLRMLRVNGNHALVPESVADFAQDLLGPVDVQTGSDGLLYYLAIAAGELRRIEFDSGNTAPVAVARVDRIAGLRPLVVRFSSTGSHDPDRDRLTYEWDFGDGTVAKGAGTSHTYRPPDAGVHRYVATLTVRDGQGGVAQDSVTITVGNRRPKPTIHTPSATARFKVGDVVTYSGSASDRDEGTLPASGLSWEVLLHHCRGEECHVHLLTSGTGAGGSFTVPDHGDQYHFQLVLVATDSVGLRATLSRRIDVLR